MQSASRIVMRPHHAVVLVLTTLMLGFVGGCGSGTTGTQVAGTQAASAPAIAAMDSTQSDSDSPPDPAQDKTDWQLVPLTEADVQLYLSVMRAAAARLQHPPASDIEAYKLAKTGMQKAQQGHPEQVTEAENKAIELVGTLQGQADTVIVDERHLDSQRYSHIVDRLEDAVVPPALDVHADGDPSDARPYVPTAHDRAVEAVKDANIKLLAPYRTEIRALQTVVRDMTPRTDA